jgi:uncharacterized membrane protein YoaK (UPF0700 family)
MKLSLTAILGINAGYVDTAGFLALHGLFTSHVTGNFVTLGSSLVTGSGGVVAKLMALPIFCVVVMATRLLSGALNASRWPELRSILTVELLLLIVGAALAVRYGPFASGDGWAALATGMPLVAAMAIQNALQRIHLGTLPPTTVMTGSTTQIMIDLADLTRPATAQARASIRVRLASMIKSVAAFAAGCAIAAFAFSSLSMVCFCIPPLLVLLAVYRVNSA